MTALSQERLAEIRRDVLWKPHTTIWPQIAAELLAHIDHLTALIGRMRDASAMDENSELVQREAAKISNPRGKQ